MLASMVDTSKGLVILPEDNLTNPQGKNISGLVTGHLETLVERIQKNKPSKLNPNEMFVLIIPTLRSPGQAVDPELCPEEGC